MQSYVDYYENDCPMYYFDNSYKTLLGACLIVFGVFGLILNGWLFATFIHSHVLIFRSHILVLNLCTGSLGRNLMGFPFAGPSALGKRWLFSKKCCKLFGFFNTFLGIFQMTSIFTICLERYFQAKYYANVSGIRSSLLTVLTQFSDKELSLKLYCILVGASWLSAIILSMPPLLDYGSYACDVTQTTCSLSWPPTESGARDLGYNIPYAIFGLILPIIMIQYIIKCVALEKRYYRSRQQKEHRRLTKSLHGATLTTLLLWSPAAVLAGWEWTPLLLYGYRAHIPPVLALLAPIASEAATCVPVLCYLAGDERLRAALLGRMRKQYALLRPDRARRYLHD